MAQPTWQDNALEFRAYLKQALAAPWPHEHGIFVPSRAAWDSRVGYAHDPTSPRGQLGGEPAFEVAAPGLLARVTSAPALDPPLPHLHRDWARLSLHLHWDCARPCHIRTAGTGLTPRFTGTGTTLPHLRRDRDHPAPSAPDIICTRTALIPCHICTRSGTGPTMPPCGSASCQAHRTRRLR